MNCLPRCTLILAVVALTTSCSFEAKDLNLVSGDGGQGGDARLSGSDGSVENDAQAARDSCAPMSASVAPILSADFSSLDTSHVSENIRPQVSIEGDESGLARDVAKEIGPCTGAWLFGQEGGYLQLRDTHPAEISVRAVASMPTEWGYGTRSVFGKDALGNGTGGHISLHIVQPEGTTERRAVLRLQDERNTFVACTEPIEAETVELRLFVGDSQSAKLFWRPWLGETWGPFVEASENQNLTVEDETLRCGTVNSATTTDLAGNRLPLHIGRTNWSDRDEVAVSTATHYSGWLSELEIYDQRLEEPSE